MVNPIQATQHTPPATIPINAADCSMEFIITSPK